MKNRPLRGEQRDADPRATLLQEVGGIGAGVLSPRRILRLTLQAPQVSSAGETLGVQDILDIWLFSGLLPVAYRLR